MVVRMNLDLHDYWTVMKRGGRKKLGGGGGGETIEEKNQLFKLECAQQVRTLNL